MKTKEDCELVIDLRYYAEQAKSIGMDKYATLMKKAARRIAVDS